MASERSWAETLRTFAEQAAKQDSPRARVSVEVTREAPFRNVARTPAGLATTLDEPEDFGGLGELPDPAEQLLAAVAASLSVTFTAHAALLGVPVEHVHVSATGEIDAYKFFHPDSAGAAGLLDTRLTLTVKSSARRVEVRRVLRAALRAAPVLRSLKRLPGIEFVHER